MTLSRTTQADLEWWLTRAAGLEWRYATTYAETAPHSYVVAGRTTGMSKDDYVRAGRVIHTLFSTPGGTGRVSDLALITPDRYAGVDPSTPVLNHLVRKHPSVAAIYPMRAEDALSRRLFTAGQFEIVTIVLERSAELADQPSPLSSRSPVAAWCSPSAMRSRSAEAARSVTCVSQPAER